MTERKILLNPGPATTTDTVKLAQVVSDICPREKEFGDLMEYISESLALIVAPNGGFKTILFGGSGTAGVESVLSSVPAEGETVIVINNGAYGKRMCDILKTYSIDFEEYVSSKIEQIDIDDFRNFVKGVVDKKNAKYISCVHSETTTGLLNDIEAIGKIAAEFKMKLIVDGMSSFAAVPIDMEKMNISFLIASSNKNIQGMAGIVFVIASEKILSERDGKRPRSFYLNLYAQYDYFIKTHQTRFTPPVQTMYALKQAIDELKKETVEKRYERYTENWEELKKGLDSLGLKRLVSDCCHSHIITTVVEPDIDGYSFDDMHDYLYSRGITIYPGKISETNTFRIANIGDISSEDISFFIKELKSYFESLS